MTTIAVDVDDTLYDFNSLAREVCVDMALETGDERLRRGAYAPWPEWRSPADVTHPDMWGDVIAECHAPDRVLEQTPYANAADTLSELIDNGYLLHYISNRHEDSFAATLEWLELHHFPTGPWRTRVSCTRDDKIGLLSASQFLIDDRPKTLVQFVHNYNWTNKHGSSNWSKQRKAFGLHTPYNGALTDIPGIKLAPNWTLLREYLIDEGVL